MHDVNALSRRWQVHAPKYAGWNCVDYLHGNGDGPEWLGNVPVEHGADANRQLYVQATFPYFGAYLGVLMVYNAATARQEVPTHAAG